MWRMNESPNQIARNTGRVMDITGAENTLILLAAPGEEVTVCGGLVAEACARGRPPFVVILGDGATNGCAGLAHERERASRLACRRLGLPDDRLLFAGLRQGHFPETGTTLFSALLAAMTEVSWRRDCNVILAPFAAQDGQDAATTWALGRALARAIGVKLLAGFGMAAPPWPAGKEFWRLDARHWNDRTTEAGLAHAHDVRNAGFETYGRLS
jgi:LmbE family N-acetylglucosaminyl deacetylase